EGSPRYSSETGALFDPLRAAIEDRKQHVAIRGWQPEHRAREAGVAVALHLVLLAGDTERRNLERRRIAPGLDSELSEPGNVRGDVVRAARDRDPAVAVARRAARAARKRAADVDRRVRLLHRL